MHTARRFSLKKKTEIVLSYLEKSGSLRQYAYSLGISYMTLWRWVKKYKSNGGILGIPYKRPGKRFSKDLEKRIMMLKEQKPYMTIDKARRQLKRKGIAVSAKGVWAVWHRYGLSKKGSQDPLNPFGEPTPESLEGLRMCKNLIQAGNLKSAAAFLNNLPSIPRDEVLRKIPERLLSPRRRLEQFYLESDKTPPPAVVRKARRISSMLEKNGYLYSSVFSDLIELYNLHNIGRAREMLSRLQMLKRKLYKTQNRSWLILYYALMATAYCKLCKFNKASEYTKKCHRLIGVSSHPLDWMVLGALHTQVGDYKKASYDYSRGLVMTRGGELFPYFATGLVVHGYCTTGDYAKAQKLLDEISIKDLPGNESEYYLGRAYTAFGQGDLSTASHFFLKVMSMSSKQTLSNHFRASAAGLAYVAAATNKKSEARTYLRRCIPLLKKYGSTGELFVMKLLLALLEGRRIPQITRNPSDFLIYLLFRAKKSLKVNHYRKVLNYAAMHGLQGLLERVIVFAPEPILHMVELGKDPGLSRTVMQYPLFNHRKTAFLLAFLGEFTVSKNGQRVNVQLTPKEKAFLIHLALRAGQPGKFILTKDIHHNFWPRSQHQADHLSHMLVRIRKKLKIWKHFLCIASPHVEPKLINCGVYFSTDYEKAVILFVQSKTFEKTDEWQYALRAFIQAIQLYRGMPFKMMYDSWSECLRNVILTQLETETKRCARILVEHKDEIPPRLVATARKAIKKIPHIIPL